MFTALKHIGARVRAFFRARDLARDFEQELGVAGGSDAGAQV